MNINLFLQNSYRSSIAGYNLAIRDGLQLNGKWDKPNFAMKGIVSCGHELEKQDLLTLTFSEKGRLLNFESVRNQWTPAWMDTYYRCTPDMDYYTNSGCICIRETKCIMENDTYISHLTIHNDKREDVIIHMEINTYMDKEGHGYHLRANSIAAALGRMYEVDCKASIACTLGEGNSFDIVIPGQSYISLRYAFAISPLSCEVAYSQTKSVIEENNPFLKNENAINDWFKENAPELRTDNYDILKCYYYRWYLIRRAIHSPSQVIRDHQIKGQCYYESPFGRWYNCPVGLSVPLHIEETRWMKDRKTTCVEIDNWVNNLGSEIGGYQGYIQYTPMAILDFYQVDPDKDWLKGIYDACIKYTFKRLDVTNPAKLPETEGSWQTGAEYQPSFYQWADEKWDWRQDEEGVRKGTGNSRRKIYRLDEIVYIIGNLLACVNMAEVLGKEKDVVRLRNVFEELREILKEKFWDDKHKFFYDIDCETEKLCNEAGCYDSFLPLMWSVVGKEYHEVFTALSDINRFATDFVIPTVEKSCPMHWFDNCIAGPSHSSVKEPHYYGCCWNGPVWPYANSVVLKALGQSAKENAGLRQNWLEMFRNYTELHFMYGDRSLPLIVEHYRSTDGVPFSNMSDYFHSEWLNLFMEYFAGISVINGKVESFEPYTNEEFTLTDVIVGGIHYEFKQYLNEGKIERNIRVIQ